ATPPPSAAPADVCVDLVNTGFEAGLVDWVLWDASKAKIDSDAHRGTKAMLLSAGSNGAEQYINAVPGQTLRLKGWVKTTAGSTASIGMRFFNANWQNLGEFTQSSTSASYTEIVLSQLTPANAKYVQVWVASYGGAVRADDMCLTRGTATQPTATATPTSAATATATTAATASAAQPQATATPVPPPNTNTTTTTGGGGFPSTVTNSSSGNTSVNASACDTCFDTPPTNTRIFIPLLVK
ncbi:MAG: hypothetical protein KIH69_017745, partial [Anaerolineae bacterium]|nr:hypothetical protein [Anaerolineae bacterium]